MSRWIKFLGAAAIVVASFFGTNFLLDRFNVPGEPCPAGEALKFRGPFKLVDGYSYVAQMPELAGVADSNETPQRSPIVVCENQWLLGPPHSQGPDVAKKGKGRFSHWSTFFIFSASDNSNPNTNGRNYFAVKQ